MPEKTSQRSTCPPLRTQLILFSVLAAKIYEHELSHGGRNAHALVYYHAMLTFALAVAVLFWINRSMPIFLLNFTCYKAPDSYRMPISNFAEHAYLDKRLTAESAAFLIKIMDNSGFSDETSISLPQGVVPIENEWAGAMEECQTVVFSVVANLSGMGCSAGIIAVDLAKDLLRVHRNSLALVVTTEVLHMNWYTGTNRSMLLANCLFRMGGTAILLSSRDRDKRMAKYELQHIVRTTKAQSNKSYCCVFQDTDTENKQGVSISKNILNIAGDALKTNIATLGPKVLPLDEQFYYLVSLICHKVKLLRSRGIYMPSFRAAFEHFSSSSIWYELSYIEAKGRMKSGDRIWQIAFGSGFKCNSAVWKCLQNLSTLEEDNPWMKCIDSYPADIPD